MENFFLKNIPGILWHYKLPQTHRCLDQTVNLSRENRCIAGRKNLFHLLVKKSIPTGGFDDGNVVFMDCRTTVTYIFKIGEKRKICKYS
jgi:hypothetical protein